MEQSEISLYLLMPYMLVSWNIRRILEGRLVVRAVSTEEEEEEMGACATKPKVSKENESAPLTRDVEVEEKKELVEGDVAEEKGEVLLKEVDYLFIAFSFHIFLKEFHVLLQKLRLDA